MPESQALNEAIDVLKDAESGIANPAKLDRVSGALLDILLLDQSLPAKVRLYLEIQEIRRGFHNVGRIKNLLAIFGRSNNPFPRRRRSRPRARKSSKQPS